MKIKYYIGLLLVLFGTLGLLQQMLYAQEAQTQPSIVYGFRMQSDMTFYLEIGALTDTADFMAGIGWNNAIWLGAHKYFYGNEEFSAFSGIELHILYPPKETIELHPALPIGFAVTTHDTTFVVEALVLPNITGKAVDVLFALSFLFKL